MLKGVAWREESNVGLRGRRGKWENVGTDCVGSKTKIRTKEQLFAGELKVSGRFFLP